jgi:MoaA/NifB/PqqE/SkfB family radical SAM enzyme
MNKLPDNFCVAPFLQLTTHPSRTFSPCPYLGGTSWKGQYNSILGAWTSLDLEELREQFLKNQQPSMCNRCWDEEKNNKKSLRVRLYDPVNQTSDYSTINSSSIITDLVNGLDSKQYLSGPKILTIKNGNVCNAKCRVCHPGDSSRWASDAIKLKAAIGHEIYTINQEEKNWDDNQLDEIFELSKNLERLELFGGEPLYNKKVIGLLNRIIDAGHCDRLNLYINTNGSIDVVDKLPRIKEFKEIEIGVSIDDIGKRFEYQRHGLEYSTVINNVQRWIEYFDSHGSKYSIDSITTVNIFNVMYLPEIKREILAILPQSPFWNLLVFPDFLFIKNLPDSVKQEVIKKLQTDPEFDDLISTINQPMDPMAWYKFKKITPELDKIRKENFDDVFPELAKLIAKE